MSPSVDPDLLLGRFRFDGGGAPCSPGCWHSPSTSGSTQATGRSSACSWRRRCAASSGSGTSARPPSSSAPSPLASAMPTPMPPGTGLDGRKVS